MLHLFGYFTSPCPHEVWRVKNLGYAFLRKISAKIYPSKVAALDDYDADMLMLKRLTCNVANDLCL